MCKCKTFSPSGNNSYSSAVITNAAERPEYLCRTLQKCGSFHIYPAGQRWNRKSLCKTSGCSETSSPSKTPNFDNQHRQCNRNAENAVCIGTQSSQIRQLENPRADCCHTAAESVHDSLLDLTRDISPSTKRWVDRCMLQRKYHAQDHSSSNIDNERSQWEWGNPSVEFQRYKKSHETTHGSKDESEKPRSTPYLCTPQCALRLIMW